MSEISESSGGGARAVNVHGPLHFHSAEKASASEGHILFLPLSVLHGFVVRTKPFVVRRICNK